MKNTPNEWSLIEEIRKKVQRNNSTTIVPLGDDGFVFKNQPGNSVICQDMMVEGTHFSLDYFKSSDVGHKALAVNLSDIAAMGGKPQFVQVSLALPYHLGQNWLNEFYQGMTELADQYGCEIVGGDLVRANNDLVIDVSVVGDCPSPLTRTGARAGDLLLTSGPLGLSHTGLLAFQNKLNHFEIAKQKHLRPTPRLDLVDMLIEHKDKVHAVMDCSDGLVNDVLRMAPEKKGFKIYSERLSLHPQTLLLADQLGHDSLDYALWGGEDFELLLAISPEDLTYFSNWLVLGQFIDSAGIFLENSAGLKEITEFKGWDHFSI